MLAYLHFETDPYESEKEVAKNHNQSDIEKFEEQKEKFRIYMNRYAPSSFIPGNTRNQIGKLNLSYDSQTTLRSLQKEILSGLTDLVGVIDAYLIR